MTFVPPKKILVTGAAGFIGSNFVRFFKQHHPSEIVAIDDLSTGKKHNIDQVCHFYHGSVLDMDLLDKLFDEHQPEYVFHFAALPMVAYSVAKPADTTQTNLIGTINLLKKARDHGVKRLVFSSSAAVYGDTDKMPINEADNHPDPQSPYAVQKYSCEQFCRIFSRLWGLDTVSLRYFNAFGPGQYGSSPYSTVIAAWLEALHSPEIGRPYIEGDGSQTRDFCYVDDISRANILAMQSERPLAGDVYNIAGGKNVEISRIKELIENLTGRSLNLEQRPPRLGDIKHSLADITKATEGLNYKPQVDLEEGIKNTIEWFVARTGSHSLMDKMRDSGSRDVGSIPTESTARKRADYLQY